MSDVINIDRYVVETLMRDLVAHDRRPAAYLVYLFLASRGADRLRAVSNQQLAEQTGLSKRGVQDALRHLEARRLIAIKRNSRTEAAIIVTLQSWRRDNT